MVAGSSEPTFADLWEVPCLQSSLEALRFGPSYTTLRTVTSHVEPQEARRLTPALAVTRSIFVSPELCLLACPVARVAQRTAT